MEDLLFFSREREPVALGSLLSGGAAPPEAPPLVVADTPLGRRRERKLRQRAGAGATLAMSTACGRKNVAVAVTATWVFLLPAYAPTYPRAARERAGGERARERRAELDEKVGATLPIISDQNTAILGGASRVRTASEEGGAGVDNCKRVARTVVGEEGAEGSRSPLPFLAFLFSPLFFSWLFSTKIFAAPHAFLGRAKIV